MIDREPAARSLSTLTAAGADVARVGGASHGVPVVKPAFAPVVH